MRARSVVLVAVAAATMTTTPAHAGTASMGGTVTDTTTGALVEGACVAVWREEGDTAWTMDPPSCTGSDGQWSKGELDAGTYYVQVLAAGYVEQYAHGRDYSSDAERFTVADGDALTVDLALERAGEIGGTVTDALTGAPVEGVCVSPIADGPFAYGCTDAEGSYLLTGMRAAEGVRLYFHDPAERYTAEYAHDAPHPDAATPFTVVAGERIQVDEALMPASSVSGRVTDATTGEPLADVCLLAQPEVDGWEAPGSACTDAEGAYRMNGVPAGTYHVIADDHSGAHPRTYHPGTTDPAASVPVTVTAGGSTTGVDLVLGPAGWVTGTVTKAATGEPMENVCVYAVHASDGTHLRGGRGPAQCSGADGRYALGGLPTGEFTFVFSPADTDYLEQASTAYAVVAGQTVDGVDAAIAEGGRISGRIVDAKTKQPVEGACATVGVYSHRAGENGTRWPSACTGPDGRYEMRGLPTGSYTVQFYDPEGAWAWQFFPNKGDRVQAAKLEVTAGTTLAGINAKLVPGGSLVGTVVDDATGEPVSGVCLDAYTARRQDVLGTSACTGEDGRYELRGFPTTKVKIHADDAGSGYGSEWAFDRATFDSATPVPTTAGVVLTVPPIRVGAPG